MVAFDRHGILCRGLHTNNVLVRDGRLIAIDLAPYKLIPHWRFPRREYLDCLSRSLKGDETFLFTRLLEWLGLDEHYPPVTLTPSATKKPATRSRAWSWQAAYRQPPATVISSISQLPVWILPRVSISSPTPTRPLNIVSRFPAMVNSSTGCWMRPFSTQKPAAPRE